MKNLNHFLRQVAQAPDEDLLLSRKDWRAVGVASIVLRKLPWFKGGLLRAFLVPRSHSLWKNGKAPAGMEFAVGVHNHRYDLQLKTICGNPVHHKWSQLSGQVHAKGLYRWDYHPKRGIEPGPFQYAYFQESVKPLTSDFAEEIYARELHTISVPQGSAAAWWAREGHLRRRDHQNTALYVRTKKKPEVPKWESFSSAEEVREFVAKFVEVELGLTTENTEDTE